MGNAAVSPRSHIILAMAKTRSGFGGLSRADAELMAAALFGYEQQRLEILEKMAELRRQQGGSAVRAATGSSDETRPAQKAYDECGGAQAHCRSTAEAVGGVSG
jgi:hypothetical protein